MRNSPLHNVTSMAVTSMAVASVALAALTACVAKPSFDAPDLALVRDDLTPFVRRQIASHALPGAWIAVLDQRAVHRPPSIWALGLDENGRLVDAETPHRVASISKLFTATCAMALAERGQVDLDAPVQRYLPSFAPQNPFERPITLRHLLGHRSGIVRESPVGHYFDATTPTQAATVASLNDTELVFEPGTRFKYSNPAVGVIGEVIRQVYGKPFEVAVRDLVLEPLSLGNSDFALRPDLASRCSQGAMWTYDGRAIPTPTFRLGYMAAAELRSSVVDLVRFAASTFVDARPRVLAQATLETMWRLPEEQARGCGLAWFVRDFDGHRLVSHNGAIYGTASTLLVLPDAGVAVAVVLTKDLANDLGELIAERALRATLAARLGQRLEAATFATKIGAERARELAGFWRTGRDWVRLYERNGDLYYDPNAGVRSRMRALEDGTLVGDDILANGGARRLEQRSAHELTDGLAKYVRDDRPPAPAPDHLLPYLGEYGRTRGPDRVGRS